MEENLDAPEVLETPETTVEETVTPAETATEETQDEKDKKIAELEEKNKKLFERAKIAEAAKKAVSANELSPKDALLLAKADVAIEDVDEVVEYAKFKRVSIADALKSPMLLGILNERKEERKTAQATATGVQRRSQVKVTDDAILVSASKGNLPEDDEGIARLTEARLNAKLKKS